ncbi:MAG: 50S ribosomal protein L4 [Lachnospiraceae bacterium]|jgi:large subunit ribosomal protein L4|nr:50S ribosomal protein L4 [Lachnospiraceae bacterium]
MANVSVYNMEGKEVGRIDLNDAVFGVEINEHLVHMAVVQQLANKRLGTQKAKTRSEVSGGGKKPWRQKGTGHARQGSIRAPQWKGGGVVFAPVPRDYSFKMNRKEKQAAIRSALTSRVQDNKFIVLDELKMDAAKTKEMRKVLENLNVKKALVVTGGIDENVILAARNLPTVRTSHIAIEKDGENTKVNSTICVYDIMKYDTVVLTKEAVANIEEVYA